METRRDGPRDYRTYVFSTVIERAARFSPFIAETTVGVRLFKEEKSHEIGPHRDRFAWCKDRRKFASFVPRNVAIAHSSLSVWRRGAAGQDFLRATTDGWSATDPDRPPRASAGCDRGPHGIHRQEHRSASTNPGAPPSSIGFPHGLTRPCPRSADARDRRRRNGGR